jgi:hypothetical protein
LSDHCPIHTLEAKLGWSDGCQWWSRIGFQHLPENVLRIVKRDGQMCRRIRCVAILLSKVFPSSRRSCLLSYYRSILPSPLNKTALFLLSGSGSPLDPLHRLPLPQTRAHATFAQSEPEKKVGCCGPSLFFLHPTTLSLLSLNLRFQALIYAFLSSVGCLSVSSLLLAA